ncbi:MAG: thiamine pyrophosphate-dependent dehydrogenase E1 component subunit alpha [Dehalococcoidia bacterium]
MALRRDTTDGVLPLKELGLTKSHVLDMYRDMLTARAVSKRLWLLGRQGKIYFVITCEGHEAAQVGSAHAMRRGEDIFIPYYRDFGVVLAAGSPPRDLFLHSLGKRADPYSGGHQLPGHPSRKDLKIVSGSSSVGTQVLHAVGAAYASRYRKENAVTIVYFGDGATSKGDLHEAMNFAGIHRLPVIFFCENNQWAISVPQSKQMAVESVAIRAEGYGFPGVSIDGNDLLQVYRITRQAAERARAGLGPTLIEAKIFRLSPHSSNDDHIRYKTTEQLERELAEDPIPRLRRSLLDTSLLTEQEDSEIQQQVQRAVGEALAEAEAAAPPREDPKPEDALSNVYAA